MYGFRVKENGTRWKVEIWELWVYEIMSMSDIIREVYVEWRENSYEGRVLGNVVREKEKVKIV